LSAPDGYKFEPAMRTATWMAGTSPAMTEPWRLHGQSSRR
jgi:hypothetical protein